MYVYVCLWPWSVPAESDPWRVTSGLCGGRGGEWGGRWQHGGSSAGGSAAVPPAPPGAVPHGAGGVPGHVSPAGGERCRGSRGGQEDLRWGWRRPGADRLPSLSPFAPALTGHCRAGGLPWCPRVRYLHWLSTPPALTNRPIYTTPRALVRCAMTSPPLSFITELEWTHRPRPISSLPLLFMNILITQWK